MQKTATSFDPGTGPAYLETEIRARYANGAREVEPELCCPSAGYEREALKVLPQEIIDKDYGCGDPSRHVDLGETVLDLGSGAGKICYILAQKVGPTGRVIGLDFNDAMLAVARKYQDEIAAKIGYRNVEFRKARIQDMALDLDRAAAWFGEHRVRGVEDVSLFDEHCRELRRVAPMIEDGTIDVIVSNCVLNLVRTEEKRALFVEMHRVLKHGGRAVISDIVCDEDPTPAILADPKLWSGCISGAFREDRFIEMFEAAGFYGVEILARSAAPWRTVDGVEFRSLTVRAFKGKEGPCLERNQAVIYRGPWREVLDDDGHRYRRGRRTAVCDKTFRIMTNPSGPYSTDILGIEPSTAVPLETAQPFSCGDPRRRDPRESKGACGGTGDASTIEPTPCSDGRCC